MIVFMCDADGNNYTIGPGPIALVQSLVDYAVSNGAKIKEVRLSWREQVAQREEERRVA